MDATGVSAFMGCSEVCPKEDAVGAFLEYLVNPLLPIKKFSHRGIPSLAEQESVAQQVSIGPIALQIVSFFALDAWATESYLIFINTVYPCFLSICYFGSVEIIFKVSKLL
ncbi:hypothetical protein MLD38_017706 [Melastoma candidum]|uniref:Uncharacterized protein n=1 Tax=Melastoma candidum TaxID=119954 RepID=A0ACB9QRE9_9MYRT|nr:hypothetical protein MLD38_017706 [Melastoma candidum]